LGGDKPVVHLAHANGFPLGTYRPLVETLTDRWRVVALPARPLWPGNRSMSAPAWRPLAEDLVRAVDALGVRDVAGVGHSVGGVLTRWADIHRPALFRALVLVDPVLLPAVRLGFLRPLRAAGLRERQPLVQRALRRWCTWPSKLACFEHHQGKHLFADWSDEALWAYVESGTPPRDDGSAELVYPREREPHIFATTPVHVWRDVPWLWDVPILVMQGEHSGTFLPAAHRRLLRLQPQARSVVVPDAGHLAPMERPAETGAAIRGFLAAVTPLVDS
jgi:pimeloyl-ACP methyl ester carboxylesterase